MSSRKLPFDVPQAILDNEVEQPTESHLLDFCVCQEGGQVTKGCYGQRQEDSSAGSGGRGKGQTRSAFGTGRPYLGL